MKSVGRFPPHNRREPHAVSFICHQNTQKENLSLCVLSVRSSSFCWSERFFVCLRQQQNKGEELKKSWLNVFLLFLVQKCWAVSFTSSYHHKDAAALKISEILMSVHSFASLWNISTFTQMIAANFVHLFIKHKTLNRKPAASWKHAKRWNELLNIS